MKISRHIAFCLVYAICAFCQQLAAQPGFKVDIDKPKPYEERVLRAEKTKDGKLKAPKRFFQNLTTHYNYFFNANNKLNEVVERAKAKHRDDYSTLLSFYNYSLDDTKSEAFQLDSVIYKSQTGLVMHDLRNDWTDELYLLWGGAYFFRKELDSASKMFQFVNYAYAPKEDDGYYQYIGSPKEGQSALTIATKEKKGIFKNTTSRNNALVWQIRTFTELNNYSEAAGLINTLRNDPNFPQRLSPALEEAQAFWFYKQQRWDSSAAHLIIAAEDAPTKQEQARWEYLAAQMFEKAGKTEEAKEWYAASIPHTTDPVMDVYARLNLVRLNKSAGDNYVDQNIAELLKMAKRDKYEDYRDIIYYMAAQMEMERNNLEAAQKLLILGSKFNNGNLASRNKAFLQIADLSYDQKKYLQAAAFYDSLQVASLTELEQSRVNERKPALVKIVQNISTINRQDSFQKIAAMPEAERNAYITKLLKQLRKQQGLKDEPLTTGSSSAANMPDLFAGSQRKGEWYFYNASLKTQGQQQFKQVWGNRPNVDNWRRSSNVSQQMVAQNQTTRPGTAGATDNTTGASLSFETLAGNIPLTPEALEKSHDSIKNALNNLGSIYLTEVGDYQSAIEALEELRRRYPTFDKMDEALFNLYYAYLKAGDRAKASQIKALLSQNFASSRFNAIAQTGSDPASQASTSPQATKDYEGIYNMFIEGRFAEAEAEKKRADSVYKTNYWQPQLLYIQSVYHIQQRNDSVAKDLLQTIVRQDANSTMAKKAQNLINALARRSQLEAELANYQIQNQPEAFAVSQPVSVPPPVTQPVQQPVSQPTTVQTQPVQQPPVVQTNPPKDTVAVVSAPVQKPLDTIANKPVQKPDVAVTQPVQKPIDTVATKPIEKPADTMATKPPVKTVDPVVQKPPVQPQPSVPQVQTAFGFTYVPESPHAAVVVLNKVDPVFVSEARNAFNRYNREAFANQPLDVQIADVNAETRLLIINNFTNAQSALNYIQQVKPIAATEIVPWLQKDKFTFSVITPANLQILKSSGDWSNYKKFTDQFFGGKL